MVNELWFFCVDKHWLLGMEEEKVKWVIHCFWQPQLKTTRIILDKISYKQEKRVGES